MIGNNFLLRRKDLWFGAGLLGACAGALCYSDYKTKKYWKKIYAQSTDQALSAIKKQRCVVFIESSSDYNGALPIMRSIQNIRDLEKRNFYPVFRTVRSSSEISKISSLLGSNENSIETLLIAGHGNSSFIDFKESPLSATSLFWTMPANSHIVLQSCSTGKEEGLLSLSLARKISFLNPRTTVIAPKEDMVAGPLTSFVSFDFINKDSVTRLVPVVRFETSATSAIKTYISNIFDRAFVEESSILPSFFNEKDRPLPTLSECFDVTVAFRNGLKCDVPKESNS